jgi:hypothetical protein
MADRLNKGQYVKYAEFDLETGNVKQVPNRQLINQAIKLEGPDKTLVLDPSPSDEDRNRAEEMAEHFKGLALEKLAGGLSSYDDKVFNIITREAIGIEDMAFIASLPSRYTRELKKERITERMTELGASSQYQFKPKMMINNLKLEVLVKFEARTFIGSVIKATDGQNLYFFTSSQDIESWPQPGQEFVIRGVVKDHFIDERDGYRYTRLTRVKIGE